MKPSNLIAAGIAVGIILWLKSKKELFDKSMFTLKGVKLDGNILRPELTVEILAINNSNQSQDINRIEGQIFLNDTTLIGNVLQPNKQTIEANKTSVISLPVNVQLDGVISTVAQLLNRKSGKFSFVGTANVYGLNVPINQSHTL